MAQVACSHGIAYCEMTPVGKNTVHCVLSGDVKGEATLMFDPQIIQDWIYQKTYLTCFNFDVGFVVLKKEVDEFNKKHYGEFDRNPAAYMDKLNKAREDRSSWSEQRDHEEMKWRCKSYCEEEKTSYIYSGDWG
jgi:hypothetical protein